MLRSIAVRQHQFSFHVTSIDSWHWPNASEMHGRNLGRSKAAVCGCTQRGVLRHSGGSMRSPQSLHEANKGALHQLWRCLLLRGVERLLPDPWEGRNLCRGVRGTDSDLQVGRGRMGNNRDTFDETGQGSTRASSRTQEPARFSHFSESLLATSRYLSLAHFCTRLSILIRSENFLQASALGRECQ